MSSCIAPDTVRGGRGEMETLRVNTEEREKNWVKKPDPRVRKDGTCVVCKKERKMAVNALNGTMNKLKGVSMKEYVDDPFCSTECCKEWHGVVQRKQAS